MARAKAAAAPEPPPIAEQDPLTLLRKRKFTPEDVAELSRIYEEVALASDPEGVALARSIVSRLRRVTHAERHPDEPVVEIDVPLAVDGSVFKMNRKPYHGLTRLPLCMAQDLLAMVDRNRRVDVDRLHDRGQVGIDIGVISGGVLAQRAAIIRNVP